MSEPSGLDYAARRMFLTGSDNPLQPPPEFMTRKQMRNFLRVNRGTGLENLRTLDCFKDTENALESKAKEKKRKDLEGRQRTKQPVYVIQRFSTTKREDWAEEVQAGCRMWVNHTTGEVSDECPYNDEDAKEEKRASRDADEGFATGALVYDNSDLLDLLSLLDQESSKTKKK